VTPQSHILIIVNPTSGRGRGIRLAAKLAAMLQSEGFQVVTRYTEGPGDAERMTAEAAADADPPACIVACGGDGTVQAVANALARCATVAADRCPAMGLAPAGRCNDFARALGVSTKAAAVAETLGSGRACSVDLGRVNDRYFCTVATVGVDAEVSRFVNDMRLPLRGTPAYLYGALRVLARYQAARVRIEVEFGVIEQPVFLASVANTSSYGGAIPIVPAASPTDGALDLCVIDAVSRFRVLTLLPSVLLGRHGAQREVRFFRSARLSITSPKRLDLWADGERVAVTPAQIEVAPAAVRIVLPQSAPSPVEKLGTNY